MFLLIVHKEHDGSLFEHLVETKEELHKLLKEYADSIENLGTERYRISAYDFTPDGAPFTAKVWSNKLFNQKMNAEFNSLAIRSFIDN